MHILATREFLTGKHFVTLHGEVPEAFEAQAAVRRIGADEPDVMPEDTDTHVFQKWFALDFVTGFFASPDKPEPHANRDPECEFRVLVTLKRSRTGVLRHLLSEAGVTDKKAVAKVIEVADEGNARKLASFIDIEFKNDALTERVREVLAQ